MSKPKSQAAASEVSQLDKVPTLPPASVDFNALHDACMAGCSADEAVTASVLAPPERETRPAQINRHADAPAATEPEAQSAEREPTEPVTAPSDEA